MKGVSHCADPLRPVPKASMSHRNAALTPRHRLKVARLVVEDGWPISEVAARFQVSWPTVKRWVDRYLAGESMHDRSSRPRTSPNKTPKAVTKRCVSLRIRLRERPVQLAARLGIAPSTVHRILSAARLNRLSYVDRATGEPVRRYEHPHPGSLVHVDVKKIGNIPDGDGWRYVGRFQGERNRAATPPGKPRNQYGSPKLGYAYVHVHQRAGVRGIRRFLDAEAPDRGPFLCYARCMRGIHFHPAAAKHGIPQRDVIYAIFHAEVEVPIPGRDGHPDAMLYIGHPHGQTGRYLEVMAELKPPRGIFIFHAMELTDKHRHYLSS